jgi:signal transduction histidine kinase
MNTFTRAAKAVILAIILACFASTAGGQMPPGGNELLTNATQIRQLTEAQAAKAVPVHIQGVMLSYAGAPPLEPGEKPFTRRAIVIADSTACIYVLGPSTNFANLQAGDLMDIEGVTDPGQFAPFVIAKSGGRIGTAPIPEPIIVNYQQLITGGLDAQWIEVSGIVRSYEFNDHNITNGPWHAELAVEGNKVTVTFDQPRPPLIEPDTEIKVKCLCFYRFTSQRQALRPTLAANRDCPITIIKSPAAIPFETKPNPISSILQFSAANVSGHRVHVRGVVTFHQQNQTLWIRDSTGVATIQTRQDEPLEPGDEVDVLGFPEYGSGLTVLDDAIFKKIKSSIPPAPWPLSTLNAAYEHDQDLVSVDALLTDVQPVLGGKMLTLLDNEKTISAVLKTTNNAWRTPDSWKPGSMVHVVGICSVVRDESDYTLAGIWHPQSFQILLRSPEDLTIVKPPNWWTPNHWALVLGSVSVILLVVTGLVVWSAKKNLREEAQGRATAEAEFAAILSERNRMAREIHDTLAQGLTAISVQLRLAKKETKSTPGPLTQHLETAQELVRSSLDEARNSIWNMRSHVLENGNLADALSGILEQMTDGKTVKANFEVHGDARRLAPMIENNILRVGQEAITNAAKHSKANLIRVRMDFKGKELQLTVSDDGTGFETTKPKASTGGFGLVGMRERVSELKGQLDIQSVLGQGTTINLQVPLMDR